MLSYPRFDFIKTLSLASCSDRIKRFSRFAATVSSPRVDDRVKSVTRTDGKTGKHAPFSHDSRGCSSGREWAQTREVCESCAAKRVKDEFGEADWYFKARNENVMMQLCHSTFRITCIKIFRFFCVQVPGTAKQKAPVPMKIESR